jgi:glycosyltransferase involved in cell wall biosynthesis
VCGQSLRLGQRILYGVEVYRFMSKRTTILLLIPHLGGGGAERVIELLARHLSSEKYEIHLCLVTQSDIGYAPLPNHVIVHILGAKRVRRGALRLFLLIWSLRPGVILSGISHLNLLVLLLCPFLPSKTKIFVRQNGPVAATLTIPTSSRVLHRLHRSLYRCADGIICQSQSMAQEVSEFTSIPLESLSVLPNPIDIDVIRSLSKGPTDGWTDPGPHLLAIGRLSREKGFDLLLKAFAKVRLRFPTADLAIAGAGPEKARLQALCETVGLDRAVRFLGQVESPASRFPGASLIVTSSRYEGVANVLLEAAAGGLPIVAVPASPGLVELLNDKPGVWLAREISAEALAVALTAALETIRPGERFAHPWIEKFRLERAIPAYEELLNARPRKSRT